MLILSPIIIWQDSAEHIITKPDYKMLSGSWRLLLLGDGGLTHHFQLITGETVAIDLLAMEQQESQHTDPIEIAELIIPIIRRQVWLLCGKEKLAWAESWWNQEQAEQNLPDKDIPIWNSLIKGKVELFREVTGLALVNALWLEQTFNCQGPFWSRHYRFFKDGNELTVIREVFSPALEEGLGHSFDQKTKKLTFSGTIFEQ
uniref:DUF98 domain-containing protein n=1 Tax=Paulinella chromatophora TaxID=39717 RepID=B1X4E7_PAUCH|nr:hypothetical protein PCC_0375 [Paulinella chromatophora]ACB42816.1 hypothetical protein PCC_0375 [Paulinella chromatophora]